MLLSKFLDKHKAKGHWVTISSDHIEKYYDTTFQGIPIAIENPKGSIRKGKGWETKMFYPYGFIKNTKGKDGDEIDVFIGPNKFSKKVFIIRQMGRGGAYVEDKVMLGFDNLEAARDAFCAHYDDQDFLGKITEMRIDQFKQKVAARTADRIRNN